MTAKYITKFHELQWKAFFANAHVIHRNKGWLVEVDQGQVHPDPYKHMIVTLPEITIHFIDIQLHY